MKELDLYYPLMRTGVLEYDLFAFEVPVGDFTQSRKRIDIVLVEIGRAHV